MNRLSCCKSHTCMSCCDYDLCNVEKFDRFNTYINVEDAIFTSDGRFTISKSRMELMIYDHLIMAINSDIIQMEMELNDKRNL